MLKPGLQSQPRIFIVNIIRKKIKRWLKDMNLMFSWYDKYLTGLLRSLVWYCFCHSNKKFTYSRHRVIPLIFRPVVQKSPKRRPFILLSFFFMEKGRNRTIELLPIHTCRKRTQMRAQENENFLFLALTLAFAFALGSFTRAIPCICICVYILKWLIGRGRCEY